MTTSSSCRLKHFPYKPCYLLTVCTVSDCDKLFGILCHDDFDFRSSFLSLLITSRICRNSQLFHDNFHILQLHFTFLNRLYHSAIIFCSALHLYIPFYGYLSHIITNVYFCIHLCCRGDFTFLQRGFQLFLNFSKSRKTSYDTYSVP